MKKSYLKYLDIAGADGFKQHTRGSAGYDLAVLLEGEKNSKILAPGEVAEFRTGISVFLNSPTLVGLVVPRSSAGKRGLGLANTVGVIDSDYQGEIRMHVVNRSDAHVTVNHLDRLAQLIILKLAPVQLEVVEDFPHETARGSGGFGSTGLGNTKSRS